MEWSVKRSVSLSARSAQLTDQKLVLRVHWQQIFNATGGEGGGCTVASALVICIHKIIKSILFCYENNGKENFNYYYNINNNSNLK